MLSQSPLHELADDALLALAESHRAMRDFASAEAEYDRLPADYPRSPLVPEASYGLGLAYYDQSLPAALDQTMRRSARSRSSSGSSPSYPDSPSVPAATEGSPSSGRGSPRRTYESARLYVTLKDGASARVYFEAVARDYPDTPWAPRALLAQARSAAADGLPDEARGAVRASRSSSIPRVRRPGAAALETSGP